MVVSLECHFTLYILHFSHCTGLITCLVDISCELKQSKNMG